VTYLPASAVDALAKDTSAQALLHRCHAAVPPPRCLVPDPRRSLARAGIKDYSKLPGVQTYSHGPYLDDWSKVPADLAAKYNTSPTPSIAGNRALSLVLRLESRVSAHVPSCYMNLCQYLRVKSSSILAPYAGVERPVRRATPTPRPTPHRPRRKPSTAAALAIGHRGETKR
jgi:hypothetical protein